MSTRRDPRHFARWQVVQKLFEARFKESNDLDSFAFASIDLNEINHTDKIDQELFEFLYQNTPKHLLQINKLIADLAPERPIKDIASTDLIILQIAIFEGFVSSHTPQKVAINEAIELSREFGSESNAKFVSGVLGALIKNKEDYISKYFGSDAQKI